MTKQLTVTESDLISALIEFERACDDSTAHIHLKVDQDGEIRVEAEAGYGISEAEFNHRMPHTVTALHRSGHGQCNLAEDWDGLDTDWYPVVREVVKRLEDAGYDVTLV